MLQRYHLLLRTPHNGCVLADERSHGWVLPVAAADSHTRAPYVVAHLLERLNIQGTVVVVTSGMVDAYATGIDWLAVADIGDGNRAPLIETPVDHLIDTRPLLPIQSDLLGSYRRLSTPPSAALRPGWLEDVTCWTAPFFAERPPATAITAMPHRTELFESTWEFRQAATSLFMKWRARGPFLEPPLARVLEEDGGASIPSTIVFDGAVGRWLTARVRGQPMTARLCPQTARRVGHAMARIQMRLADADSRLRAIGVPDETLSALAEEGDRILDRLSCESDPHDVRAARAAIHAACGGLDDLRLPTTWIHTDFAPENTFVGDDDAISFIDLEEPWIGPAPIVMEFLYAGVRRHTPDGSARVEVIASAGQGFVEAWEAHVPNAVMRRAFRSTRLVAEVLRIARRLRSLAAKEKAGELTGFLEPAAQESARRLVRLAVTGCSADRQTP